MSLLRDAVRETLSDSSDPARLLAALPSDRHRVVVADWLSGGSLAATGAKLDLTTGRISQLRAEAAQMLREGNEKRP